MDQLVASHRWIPQIQKMCKPRLRKASHFPGWPGSLFWAERSDVIHWPLCNENQRISFPRICQAGKGVFRSQNSEAHNSFWDGAVKVEQKFLALHLPLWGFSPGVSLPPQLRIPFPGARQAQVHGKQLNAASGAERSRRPRLERPGKH